MSSSEQWRWTDDEGVQRLLREEELRAALADGRLKPDTLVWKRGMSGWKPADEVPELMDLDDDGPETITEERKLTLGKRMAPTPSIPPTPSGIRPANMVDIADLHARQGRPLVPTLMGVGSGKKPSEEAPKPNVRIPVAPKLPAIDGGWKEGAARRDDDEQTVTKIRDDDEPSTLSSKKPLTKKQRTKSYSAGAKSAPPPRKRDRQTQPTGSLPAFDDIRRAAQRRGLRPDGGGAGKSPTSARTLPSEKSETRGTKTVPPPVKSSEVLSEAFESPKKGGGTPRPGGSGGGTLVSADDDSQDQLVAAAAKAQRPVRKAARKSAGKSAPPPAPRRSTMPPRRSAPPPAPKRSRPPSAPPPAPKRSRPPSAPPPAPRRSRPPSAPPPAPQRSRPPSSPPAAEPAATATTVPGSTHVDEHRAPAYTGPLPAVRPADASAAEVPAFAKEPWRRPSSEQLADLPGGSAAPAEASEAKTAEPPIAVAQQPQGSLVGSIVGGAPAVQQPMLSRVKDSFTRNTAVAAAGIAIALVGASFLLGRLSAPAQAGMSAAVARTGFITVPLFARAKARAEPPRPCLMKRAPAQFAPAASKSIPIELASAGERLAVGYARTMTEPRGMLVDLETGQSEVVHQPDGDEDSDVSRVVPVIGGGEVSFATTLAEQGEVTASVSVAATSPYVVGFTDDHFVRQPERGAEASPLWPLDPPGKGGDALQASVVGDEGVAVAYRYDGQIHFGTIGADGAVVHPAKVVAGSGGKVGKPSVANNGREVSVVFADKPPAKDARIEIRWARGEFGEPLRDAVVVELPPGGPGGDAIAPAISALPHNRWLLMWTEGRRPGPYTLRAQTYDRKFRPVGAALRVSPGTGSFGQGTVGVVGEDAAVLFLLATSQGYEIWGTVLQCR